MYRYHKFEFKYHVKRMLVLYILTMLSCAYLFVNYIYGITYLACSVPSNYPMYDPDSDKPGICDYIVKTFTKDVATKNKAIPTVLLFIYAQYLVPVVVFLLIDTPHDCFVCLGKDPDRIYSTFQLKRSERTARKMFAKYSSNTQTD